MYDEISQFMFLFVPGLYSPMSRAALMARGTGVNPPPHHLGNGATKPFPPPPQGPAPPFPSQLLNPETSGLSSIETLLMNIQGLIKVAVENSRHREQQVNFEKGEKVYFMCEVVCMLCSCCLLQPNTLLIVKLF